MLHTSLEGVVESQHDAVWRVCHVARLDAVERARFGLLQTLLYLLEERVVHRTSRHTYGTLDDLDILLFRIDVTLLEQR